MGTVVGAIFPGDTNEDVSTYIRLPHTSLVLAGALGVGANVGVAVLVISLLHQLSTEEGGCLNLLRRM